MKALCIVDINIFVVITEPTDYRTLLSFCFLHFRLMVVVSTVFREGKYEENGSKDLLECPIVSIECVPHFIESKHQQNLLF